MKRLNHFESSIIGLFIGVIFASYLTYLEGLNRFVGLILNWVSLTPVFNLIKISDNQRLIFLFLFVVLVFIVYGFIVGLIMRGNKKLKFFVIFIILVLIIGMIIEQRIGSKSNVNQNELNIYSESLYVKPVRNDLLQYFNEGEIRGDLNGDEKDDIVFMIPREEKDRGTLYYFTAALGSEKGYAGTNLLFLGEGFEPVDMNIEEGRIVIKYVGRLNKNNPPKIMYAEIVDGVLKQVKSSVKDGVATTTES